MNRLIRLLILAALLVGVGSAIAQDTTTPTPPLQDAFPTLPPVDTPQPLTPTPTVTPGVAAPTPGAATTLGTEQTEALPILINARADLDLLADTALGVGKRPVGWSGSIDVTDTQLPLWIRLDLETLVGVVMGVDKRPAGWFGVVPSIPLAVARDIRHDLELLADVVVGAPGLRPAGWKGDDPIMRCDRTTQALFTLLQQRGLTIPVDFTQPDYCAKAAIAASIYVERQVLQPPAPSVGNVAGNQVGRYQFLADNPFVVAFLDRKALHKIGVLPVGTGFEPVARSYVDFSNMMLVRGDNFQVFVDYTTTQLTTEQFTALPDVGGGTGSGTDCQAAWCGQGLN